MAGNLQTPDETPQYDAAFHQLQTEYENHAKACSTCLDASIEKVMCAAGRQIWKRLRAHRLAK